MAMHLQSAMAADTQRNAGKNSPMAIAAFMSGKYSTSGGGREIRRYAV
ncbi:MAG: hypothetical protein L0I29_09500 [Hyphomicrobiales bacterium]|nr:hypothetical protein [Hyphomicrobiales bacterium]